jgi:hypothetical protein
MQSRHDASRAGRFAARPISPSERKLPLVIDTLAGEPEVAS